MPRDRTKFSLIVLFILGICTAEGASDPVWAQTVPAQATQSAPPPPDRQPTATEVAAGADLTQPPGGSNNVPWVLGVVLIAIGIVGVGLVASP